MNKPKRNRLDLKQRIEITDMIRKMNQSDLLLPSEEIAKRIQGELGYCVTVANVDGVFKALEIKRPKAPRRQNIEIQTLLEKIDALEFILKKFGITDETLSKIQSLKSFRVLKCGSKKFLCDGSIPESSSHFGYIATSKIVKIKNYNARTTLARRLQKMNTPFLTLDLIPEFDPTNPFI